MMKSDDSTTVIDDSFELLDAAIGLTPWRAPQVGVLSAQLYAEFMAELKARSMNPILVPADTHCVTTVNGEVELERIVTERLAWDMARIQDDPARYVRMLMLCARVCAAGVPTRATHVVAPQVDFEKKAYMVRLFAWAYYGTEVKNA